MVRLFNSEQKHKEIDAVITYTCFDLMPGGCISATSFYGWGQNDTEDHRSCIAHLSAEDMLKLVVIEEKKFKHSPWAGADNPLGPIFFMSTGRPHHYGHLLQF